VAVIAMAMISDVKQEDVGAQYGVASDIACHFPNLAVSKIMVDKL